MGKALVAFFSATGVTADLAARLAREIGGDLFEITPADPYTDADLDWNDQDSRSSVEMRDRSSRPPVAGRVADMESYDLVFVGFPIWWYREPSIIDTFVEQYDFTGKTFLLPPPGAAAWGTPGGTSRNWHQGRRFRRGKGFPPGPTVLNWHPGPAGGLATAVNDEANRYGVFHPE